MGEFAGRGRQHTTPLVIDRLDEAGTAHALQPLGLGRGDLQHDESWLQKLIFRFPQVLPVHEIEPGFGRLVPVCLELPTPAGSVDNLYVTETGNLVIAECKLWRNPEARREVVAQIIDYAHALASWTFEDLQAAVRDGITADADRGPESLYELVGDESEIAEEDFVDAVSRNLRLGRILLLIVGDGVREGVESLATFLQLHAGFHFTLAIVELPVFHVPEAGFLVQPRVLARTVNIERGIVKIADGRAAVEAPSVASGTEPAGRRTSISQERQMEMLSEVEPGLPEALQSFVDRAGDVGVVLEAATKSLQLRWRGPGDQSFALGGIGTAGELQTHNVNWTPDSIGHVELAHRYLERIASLIGAEVRRTNNPAQWYLTVKGTTQQPKVMALLVLPDEWLAAIEGYVEELRAAIVPET